MLKLLYIATGVVADAGESRVDLLVNNAGVIASERHETEDGFETHFAVNHLGIQPTHLIYTTYIQQTISIYYYIIQCI